MVGICQLIKILLLPEVFLAEKKDWLGLNLK